MKDIPNEQIQAFVETCHRVAAQGLLRCSSGNMSWRVDDKRFLVSASGSWMGGITPEQISLCRLDDASLLEGRRPSVETLFHAGVLRSRPDIEVVLHFQSPCATTLGCMADAHAINYAVIPEIPVYIGPIATISYQRPGSPELAEAVVETLQSHDLVQLAHHGQVTTGRNLDDALQKAAFFELACSILLHGGKRVEPLPPDVVSAFHAQRPPRPAVLPKS